MLPLLLEAGPPGVVWVKQAKPVFDLWGVLVGSLALAGLLAVVTLCAGGLLALGYILRGKRFGAEPAGLRLALDEPAGAGSERVAQSSRPPATL